jgi:protein-disulfide isomerase
LLGKYPQDVKLVHKNYPLRNHSFAVNAAKAALAADRQGKFWEFHDELMKNQKDLNDAKVMEIATALGLDLEPFKKDIQDPAIQRLILRDMNEGRQAKVRGIPAVYINGKFLKSRSPQGFDEMIQSELDKHTSN